MKSNRLVLRDVNRCIYCHTTEGRLTQEHIVPFGLNGEHVLLHASCDKCAAITSKIELSVLRYSFIAARNKLNLRSRHTKAWENPKDAFITLIFPIVEPPAHLSGEEYVSGVKVKGLRIIPLTTAVDGKTKTIFDGNNLEKMIAKIALGFAIGQIGFDAFEEFYVIKAILGEVDDIGKWVGMTERNTVQSFESLMYYVNVEIVNQEFICRIKVFAMFNPPEYIVVVGRVKSNVSIVKETELITS